MSRYQYLQRILAEFEEHAEKCEFCKRWQKESKPDVLYLPCAIGASVFLKLFQLDTIYERTER